ncbi:MAG TPA: sialidase family protein [Gemmatimonadaceae bacterium]|nr:sialidase family protein [Gemmatimonadaceae bacterium]
MPSARARAFGFVASFTAATLFASACEPRAPEVIPTFETIDTLASPAGPRSGEPNVVAGPDGKVWLSWLETTDSTTALRVASFDGNVWSPASTVTSRRDLFVNWADFPSVFAAPGGRLVAHWLQRSDTGKYAYDVRVARSSDSGRTWSNSMILHRDRSAAEHGFVSLFAGAGDSVSAVWLDGRKYPAPADSDEMQLATTTLAHDGSLGAETMIDERICDCCQTDVAVTARGPIVAYRDRSDTEIRDIYVVRREGGGWATPVLVHQDGWKIPGCPVNGPALAARGDTVVVAWFTAAEDTARVRLAYSYDAGTTFAAPLRIDGGRPIGRVDVQLGDSGQAVVAWLERTDSATAEVRLRSVAPSGALSPPLTLGATSGSRASGFPRMALQQRNGASDLIVAWTSPSDTSRVWVARTRLR